MTRYIITADEGAEVNGTTYPKGHIFDFDTVPDHFNAVIDSGAIRGVEDLLGNKNVMNEENTTQEQEVVSNGPDGADQQAQPTAPSAPSEEVESADEEETE